MKKLLLALLLATRLAHATPQSVSLDAFGINYLPVQQYGLWSENILNWPSQYSVTQGGLWNVGQYGQWYVGQYGNWYVSLANGAYVSISGPVQVASAVPLTVTTGGVPLPVTFSGGISFNASNSPIPISATATISGFSPLTATADFGLNMGYDSNTSTWRSWYLASTGDNASAIQFPGMVGYGIYNSTLPTLTSGKAGRNELDIHGGLLTSPDNVTWTGVRPFDTTSSSGFGLLGWNGSDYATPIQSTAFGDLHMAMAFYDGRPFYAGVQPSIQSVSVVQASDQANFRTQLQDLSYTVGSGTISRTFYADLTITSIGAAASNLLVFNNMSSSQLPVVVGWSFSSDTAVKITLHFESPVVSNYYGIYNINQPWDNVIDSAVVGAYGGVRADPNVWIPGLAQGDSIYVDFDGPANKVTVHVAYKLLQ